MRRLCLVAILGCSQPASPPVTNEAPPTAARTPRPFHVEHMVWQGHYVCAQGVTGLRLTIDPPDAALFEFYAVGENPTVPNGSYTMIGALAPGPEGGIAIAFAPGDWLVQPTGYMMVGLAATSDPELRRLRGTITDPSCGELDLERR